MTTTGWIKQLKSLAIASTGAGLTYLAANITQVDFGVYTPAIVAIMSVLVNMAKTFLEERT